MSDEVLIVEDNDTLVVEEHTPELVAVDEHDTLVVEQVQTDVLMVDDHQVLVLTECGTQGPPGPPGPGTRIVDEIVAGEVLGGHRVVTIGADGLAYYADNATSPVPNGALWVTVGAALAGELVQVVTFGPITEPSWNWIPNRPVFLGTNGMLTQTAPTGPGRFLARVGVARAVDTLHVERFPSVVLI